MPAVYSLDDCQLLDAMSVIELEGMIALEKQSVIFNEHAADAGRSAIAELEKQLAVAKVMEGRR